MKQHCNRHGQSSRSIDKLTRRSMLETMAASTVAPSLLGCGTQASWDRHKKSPRAKNGRQQSTIHQAKQTLGLPGPWPGRVVEVGHSESVHDGRRNRNAVKMMVAHGMQQLVPGAEDSIDAWRYFFQKGDRVGIKVVPVGKVAKPGSDSRKEQCIVDLQRPGSISSYEVILEVIESLLTAGIRRPDILVFERYRNEFIHAGYTEILPDGIHWECSSAKYDEAQLEIDGQLRGQPRRSHVAGYDRDVFRELAFCQPPDVHDPSDDRRFRSHLSKIVTQKLDKIISIPVLKDHRTGGVTLALKNMSHGLVNNVARSHVLLPFQDGGLNHCQTFIPAAVSLPQIREKCVLQILDGLVGTYEGGPGNWNRSFATWENRSLLFATDPVALDHIGWKIIDAKRLKEGWPPIAQMGLDSQAHRLLKTHEKSIRDTESFHIRQPQHVSLAALLDLGVFDPQQIDHQKYKLA